MVKKGPARLSLAVVRGRESQLAGKRCPTPVIHTSGAADVLRLTPQTRETLRASATENLNGKRLVFFKCGLTFVKLCSSM